jgi:hypothetical protein
MPDDLAKGPRADQLVVGTSVRRAAGADMSIGAVTMALTADDE